MLTIHELISAGWRLTLYESYGVCTVERGTGQETGLGYSVNAEFYEMRRDGPQWKELERMMDSGELRAEKNGAIVLG